MFKANSTSEVVIVKIKEILKPHILFDLIMNMGPWKCCTHNNNVWETTPAKSSEAIIDSSKLLR